MKLSTILSAVILFVLGYLLAAVTDRTDPPQDIAVDLEKIQKERDSIQLVYDAAIKREQAYILAAEQDSIRAAEGERKVAALEKKTRTYAYRLKEMEALVISQPDSFLIKRYPDQ